MSEFKLTGDYYVSEWNGSSANPGTATSPFAHPADAPVSATNIVVVGTGYYKGSISGSRKLLGDGRPIIDFLGANWVYFNMIQEKIHFKNVGTLGGAGSSAQNSGGIDCIYENVVTFDQTLNNSVRRNTRCIFLPQTLPIGTSGGQSINFDNSIILTSINSGGGCLAMFYSFIAKGCFVIYSGTSATFVNNCYNGIIRIASVDYELKKLIDGSTRPDADPLIADLATASGFSDTYTTRGNFAGDPKFVDVLSRVVEPGSDLLKKSSGFGYIGGATSGKLIPVNSSDPNVLITITDIDTTDPLNWIILPPATEGFINIVWKISDTIAEVQRIFLDALLSFYGDAVGGTTENNNVPDNFPTSYSTLSAAGLKPNRLIYELRTSQSIGMPTVDSQWDNDSVALGTTAGNYYLQEWNTKPTIATVLGVPYGNGNPLGIGGATNGINARWGQAKIRLTNNRAY